VPKYLCTLHLPAIGHHGKVTGSVGQLICESHDQSSAGEPCGGRRASSRCGSPDAVHAWMVLTWGPYQIARLRSVTGLTGLFRNAALPLSQCTSFRSSPWMTWLIGSCSHEAIPPQTDQFAPPSGRFPGLIRCPPAQRTRAPILEILRGQTLALPSYRSDLRDMRQRL